MRRLELANVIIDEIQQEHRRIVISQDEANLMINTLLREIASAVNEGRMVAIRGFGSFKPKIYRGNTNSGIFKRKAKTNRIKDTTFTRPTFKAGSKLRNV